MNDHDPKLTAHGPIPLTRASSSLPIELAELVLASAIHRTAIASLWNPTSIAQPLNALPRSAAPVLTQVALIHLPHVDLDAATKLNNVDLLKYMFAWSKQPGGRPVNYTDPMAVGMCVGSLDALDWWLDESGLYFQHGPYGIAEACRLGRLDVLQWWQTRGYLGSDTTVARHMPEAVRAATRAGHVFVLDWLLGRFPEIVDLVCRCEDQECDCKDSPIMEVAAESGQVAVVEWWFDKCMHGSTGEMPSLVGMLLCALEKGCAPILEWCKWQMHAAEEYMEHQSWMCALELAVRGHMLDWLDLLGIVPSKGEYEIATEAACATGNVDALKWLQAKDWLVGTRSHLFCCTKGEAWKRCLPKEESVLQTFQWIHDHVALESGAPEKEQDEAAQYEISKEQLIEIAEGMIELMPWESQDIAVWKWWLARLGPLDIFAESFADSSFYHPRKNPHCIAILQLWIDSGASLDFATYIRFASKAGNLAVLDWLLHTLSIPIARFVNSQGIRTSCTAATMLWWRGNIPQEWAPVTKAAVCNPIMAYILKSILKISHFRIDSAAKSSESGNVPMLMNLPERGSSVSLRLAQGRCIEVGPQAGSRKQGDACAKMVGRKVGYA